MPELNPVVIMKEVSGLKARLAALEGRTPPIHDAENERWGRILHEVGNSDAPWENVPVPAQRDYIEQARLFRNEVREEDRAEIIGWLEKCKSRYLGMDTPAAIVCKGLLNSIIKDITEIYDE